MQRVALDSGYYSWSILECLENKEIFSVVGYLCFSHFKDKKYFIYDSEKDCIIYKLNGEIYTYKNIDRQGYKHYKSSVKSNKRIIQRHLKADLYDRARQRRLSDEGKVLYQKCKTTIERSFADSKQNHGYRYAQYRGLAKMQQYTWLSCATQNMKK